MLRQIYRENEKVVISNELVEISDRACWVDLIAPSAKELELVSRRFAIDFRPRTGGIVEEPTYLYMRVSSVSPQEGSVHQVSELDTLGADRPETNCKLR